MQFSGGSILNNGVRFDFHEPVGVDKAHDLHDCVGRSNVCKELAVDSGYLFPIFDSGEKNSGTKDIGKLAA
jgi:hypothetical protein